MMHRINPNGIIRFVKGMESENCHLRYKKNQWDQTLVQNEKKENTKIEKISLVTFRLARGDR